MILKRFHQLEHLLGLMTADWHGRVGNHRDLRADNSDIVFLDSVAHRGKGLGRSGHGVTVVVARHVVRSRFKREPEAMWLPETAADLETLDVLAECGVGFTILAPDQASRVRPLGTDAWTDVSGGRVDPTMPYRVRTPGGRELGVFFYDGPISRAVAFEGILQKGEYLADRLLGAFVDSRSWPQVVHIATDGETYGHHQPHGDMALAYAVQYIERNQLARLTNYSEYLTKHPPSHQVQIYENTSWSCVHGIERWRSDCGCNSGMHSGWHQRWRGPLREALDWLRDAMAGRFELRGAALLKDPWAARNDYIELILDRSRGNAVAFLDCHATHPLSPEERVRALKLLELHRHAMLMYTSCGWFFDEVSGIETVQVLQYAGRVLQLNRELFGDDLEPGPSDADLEGAGRVAI